jgi:hypothetical protein
MSDAEHDATEEEIEHTPRRTDEGVRLPLHVRSVLILCAILGAIAAGAAINTGFGQDDIKENGDTTLCLNGRNMAALNALARDIISEEQFSENPELDEAFTALEGIATEDEITEACENLEGELLDDPQGND